MIWLLRRFAKGRVLFAGPAVALLVLALPASPLLADENTTDAAFTVYWNGLGIVRSETRLVQSPRAYQLDIRLWTQGILYWFLDFKTHISIQGRRDDQGALQPDRYQAESVWNGSQRSTLVEFGANGRETRRILKQPRPDEREPVPDIRRRSPDPMTALVAAMMDPGQGPRHAVAYDGRRVYLYTWHCNGETEPVPWSWYAALSGDAHLCRVAAMQLAGADRAVDYENIELSEAARLWLMPGRVDGVSLPVRLEMDTNYGYLMAEMDGFKNVQAPDPAVNE